jgi:hypothetical protein
MAVIGPFCLTGEEGGQEQSFTQEIVNAVPN